ncbi:MAG TPA: DUF1800 domain-containing protein [Gemmatimonadaceae bacterium]|nr:DUF1800 domain-containing protein [Gemmatimonadaceae bacterium]
MRTTERTTARTTAPTVSQTLDDREPSGQSERPSRRSFVFFAAAAAAALVPGAAKAQGRTRRKAIVSGRSPEPSDAFPMVMPNESVGVFAEWDTSVGRLVRRVAYGITAADVTQANALGYDGYLEQQLNYTRIDDSAVESYVAQKWPLLAQTSDQLFTADQGTLETQLRASTIYRAAFSQRQLYQRMVELWSDHFNQDYDKVGYLLAADQRDVIRKHALGRFPDLLKASAHSASMMVYLDQVTSSAAPGHTPNQNYAREIMELHTLSVNGGYTQDDVAELSRVLTGWTIQGRGNFVFNPAIHDWKAKTVLGVNIPAGSPSLGAAGINEGEQMLNVLTAHPSTARFIATKMLSWLLTPAPSDDQVSTVASVYRATGGDIKAMIRVILNESWVSAAPLKLKRPFHYLASALRSANPTITAVDPLVNQLNTLGHPIFSWDTPDGFPDKIEYWAGNIVPRWAFGTTMANFNSTTTLLLDTSPYRAGSQDAAIELIDQNFFGGEMLASTRTALTAYLKAGTFTDARVRETIALAIASNGFQWY